MDWRMIQYPDDIKILGHLLFQGATYFRSHRIQKGTRKERYHPLRDWERRFYKQLVARDVPMYVDEYTDTGVCVRHCFLPVDEIPRQAWEVIGRIGLQIADDLRIRVRWGGDMPLFRPTQWEHMQDRWQRIKTKGRKRPLIKRRWRRRN